MGCMTSSDNSEASYHPEENFERGFWSSLKKNYKVKQTNELPITPTTQSLEDVSKDVLEEETSDGYHSETISTANTSNISFDPSDCDLKMEMYMMTKISRVMPKTSSPILPRSAPAINYNIPSEETEPRSYRRWKQNLQLTPPYVLTNIARIPEAIAGQFTPEGFPMYTDVKRCQAKPQKSLIPLVRL